MRLVIRIRDGMIYAFFTDIYIYFFSHRYFLQCMTYESYTHDVPLLRHTC